jgi:hypothetical protein
MIVDIEDEFRVRGAWTIAKNCIIKYKEYFLSMSVANSLRLLAIQYSKWSGTLLPGVCTHGTLAPPVVPNPWEKASGLARLRAQP